MTVGADFAFLMKDGIDARTFESYNAAVADNTIGLFDRNFGTSVNPNAFRILVAVSSSHVVTTIRPYGTTGAVTIPIGGYVLNANGTELPHLSRYAVGDFLEIEATANCESRHDEGVPVIMFHDLGASGAAFESQIQAIDAAGYTTVSLDDLEAYLGFPSVPLPADPIVLTFDDAYDSQFAYAPAILDAYGMVGNFFVITSFPNNVAWVATWDEINDALFDYPDSVVLGCHSNAAHYQVTIDGKLVAAYMTPINGETEEEFYDRRFLDMYDCREKLYEETGVDTVTIAWPFGSYDEGLVNQAVDAGFEMAMGTFPGLNHPDNDGALLNVRRFGSNAASPDWSTVETTMDRWVVCP